MNLPWHLYTMAFAYIKARISHFRIPSLYLKIIPPYFPNSKLLNSISLFAKFFLAIMLSIPVFSKYAACGITALLIAVSPSQIYILPNEKTKIGTPKWILLLNLPLQLTLTLN